jgi:hypothetical protein
MESRSPLIKSGKYLEIGTRFNYFFVSFQKKNGAWLTHLLRSSAVSKLSKRRLAPPSAQQCHCDEFQSLRRRGRQKGWFKIMRAWPIVNRGLTPFVDWRNLTFQVFIFNLCKYERQLYVNEQKLTQLWVTFRPSYYSPGSFMTVHVQFINHITKQANQRHRKLALRWQHSHSLAGRRIHPDPSSTHNTHNIKLVRHIRE